MIPKRFASSFVRWIHSCECKRGMCLLRGERFADGFIFHSTPMLVMSSTFTALRIEWS